MSFYLLVATGPLLFECAERRAPTAAEALVELSALQRLAGGGGTVDVWGPNGRRISHERLEFTAVTDGHINNSGPA